MSSPRVTSEVGQLPHVKKDIVPLIALCFLIYGLWTLWALWIREAAFPQARPPVEVASGLVARIVLWGGPCAWYLWSVYRERALSPLGLGFPLGKNQVWRTVLLTLLVTAALFAATATRNGLPLSTELNRFISAARLRLTAPIFEELVFRGVILSEMLNWTHANSKDPWGLRARYWAAQIACAAFFVFIHWPAWWASLGLWAVAERSLPIFAVGMVLGFVFAHTRSIWPCIWLHWLNNELSLMG